MSTSDAERLHRKPGADVPKGVPGQLPPTPPEPGSDVPGPRDLARTTFTVEGMTCGHCVRAVEEALEQDGVIVEGVTMGKASVQYDPAVTSREKLAEAIADEGYRVTG